MTALVATLSSSKIAALACWLCWLWCSKSIRRRAPKGAILERSMVRFENVGMRYGAGPEVLRDVSFALDPGSLTFLTGPSGAGKSTLLKLVFMAERPSRGLISLFGRDLAIRSGIAE